MYDWRKEHCLRCVNTKDQCINCSDNPIYADYPKQSKFMAYIPLCPRGYTDCVSDPAYIRHYYPDLYTDRYGELTPTQAIFTKGGCMDMMKADPDEMYYCYDDEDK